MWKELVKDTVPQRLTLRLENANRVTSVDQTQSSGAPSIPSMALAV